MKNLMVLSFSQLAKLVPDSEIDAHSVRGRCNAYVLLLAARNLSKKQVVELTGFTLSMVSDCYSKYNKSSMGRINDLIFTSFSMLTHEEVIELRREMKRDGQWMRAQMLEMHEIPSST